MSQRKKHPTETSQLITHSTEKREIKRPIEKLHTGMIVTQSSMKDPDTYKVVATSGNYSIAHVIPENNPRSRPFLMHKNMLLEVIRTNEPELTTN